MDRLNTLWFEGRLGYMEQLSIASALAQGHQVRIFSYNPGTLAGVPDAVEMRDAREVMDDERRVRLFEGKYKALGSDFFRYELFAKGLGYWMDLDVILLRPLDYELDHVFGWEHDTSINGAILKLPADSPMLHELRNVPETNWLPPFFGPRRTLLYYWQRFRRGEVKLEDLPWGAAGPALITYLARKHGKQHLAQAREVFYPVPYGRAEDLFAEARIVEGMLTPATRAVHMWHSRLTAWHDRAPPPGSYMDRVCRTYGIDPIRRMHS
ncbi:hypothetical protein ACWPM1_13750 [Tsuneonella sp. HG249]